jgi:hypothetical protein
MEEGYELISKMIILSKNGLLDYNIKFWLGDNNNEFNLFCI